MNKSIILFGLLCLPMFKAEASPVCSVQCSLLEACQTPVKKVVKKKVKKKSYMRVTKQVEVEKMCDPLTLPVMSFEQPKLPHLYMPNDLVRETPVYPTQIIYTGGYNGVFNPTSGNWFSSVSRPLVGVTQQENTPTPTPLPASALLFPLAGILLAIKKLW